MALQILAAPHFIPVVPERVMYWCDAKIDRVERADLDGSRRTLLVQTDEDEAAYNHFDGLALDRTYLYISDRKKRLGNLGDYGLSVDEA